MVDGCCYWILMSCRSHSSSQGAKGLTTLIHGWTSSSGKCLSSMPDTLIWFLTLNETGWGGRSLWTQNWGGGGQRISGLTPSTIYWVQSQPGIHNTLLVQQQKKTSINFALMPVKDSKHLMLKTLESSPLEVRQESEGDLRSLLASQSSSTLGASDTASFLLR